MVVRPERGALQPLKTARQIVRHVGLNVAGILRNEVEVVLC